MKIHKQKILQKVDGRDHDGNKICCLVTKKDGWYNFYVDDIDYQQDELNQLTAQEPEDYIEGQSAPLQDVLKIKAYEWLYKHIIWKHLYGIEIDGAPRIAEAEVRIDTETIMP